MPFLVSTMISHHTPFKGRGRGMERNSDWKSAGMKGALKHFRLSGVFERDPAFSRCRKWDSRRHQAGSSVAFSLIYLYTYIPIYLYTCIIPIYPPAVEESLHMLGTDDNTSSGKSFFIRAICSGTKLDRQEICYSHR
jgi:hypothetical protein